MTAFYITTAIEYANGEPHLGHAFEKIAADAIARFHRLRGDADVRLLVGTDEHGQKVARAASAAGLAPAEQAERITTAFRAAWDALGISYDVFSRTTAPSHRAGVLALVDRILARRPDAFYERAYEGRYCVGCESFKTEHDLQGGRCPLHRGQAIERVSETNWFFRLSAFQEDVARLLRERPDFVQPESRRNEVVSFVERGLEDVSITRANLDWGIPFPLASRSGAQQVIYVWFDALPNYLTAVGFPEPGWEARWPAQLHVVGKDITRFHCVIWPAILIAAGLPLPERVWAHGFVTVDGERLSKSAGVWVELRDAIARHGPDALRYYLLREIPFDGDGDFSWRRFDAHYAADLANTLGNLASRVTALVVRHCAGGAAAPPAPCAAATAEERALAEREAAALDGYVRAFESNRPHRALAALWDALAAGNELISRTRPWELASDPARRGELERTLGVLVRLLARQAVLLAPVLPVKSEELWRTLGGPGSVHDQRLGGLDHLDPTGWRVTRGAPLFPRAASQLTAAAK
ncbi:MAG TPA: methionine--tRNA ligase [Gemmatimonadaceae bacterium]|nr:methionine--tRNA ligase [Gemmatimonadaceae bacterium]